MTERKYRITVLRTLEVIYESYGESFNDILNQPLCDWEEINFDNIEEQTLSIQILPDKD